MLPASFTPSFLKQLELFTLRSRRSYLGSRQGGHLSPKRGHGIEFSDYRQYELGDNPRWIDWGIYARTERLYVRRYQEEENLSVMIILDTSASMSNPPSDTKWERAREIALALGYVALISQDTVFAAPLGDSNVPDYYGPRAIHSFGKFLFEVPLGRIQSKPLSFTRAIQRAAARVRFPGMSIVISDFLMPLSEIRSAFNTLLAKNLDVMAIQILGDTDLHPFNRAEEFNAVDSETGEEIELSGRGDSESRYEHLLKSHTQNIQKFCSSRGIRFTQVIGSDNLSKTLLNSLAKTGLLS